MVGVVVSGGGGGGGGTLPLNLCSTYQVEVYVMRMIQSRAREGIDDFVKDGDGHRSCSLAGTLDLHV